MSSNPLPTFEDAATAVHGLVPQQHGTEVIVLPEVVKGRMVLHAYGVQVANQGEPGDLGMFQDHRFELAEVSETLVLEKQPRVYEEIILSKTAVDRVETVTAVLRHQEAEVIVEDARLTGIVSAKAPTGRA